MKYVLTLFTTLGVAAVSPWAWADDIPTPATSATTPTTTTTGAAGTSTTSETCVPASVEAALQDCTGKAHFEPKGASPHSLLPTALPKSPAAAPTRAGAASLDGADLRDVRRASIGGKVEDLLKKEIVQLEGLFKSTRKTDPDRPNIARRLAETYVEWEGLSQRKKTEAEIAKNDAEAVKQKKTADSARASAIRYYALIVSDHPTYVQIDEVDYYLAYEYEQGMDVTNARSVYQDILHKTPQSKYVPNAYLAFGELFFTEGQSDPSNYSFAEASYEQVLRYPAPANKLWGYAKYKLAYVYWNLGDKSTHLPKALAAFKEVIEYGYQYAGQPGAKGLGEGAKKDIVPVYAMVGDPARAYDFFKPLAASPPDDRATFEMMDSLGASLLDTGQYTQAITLYTDLSSRDKGDNGCTYQARIVQAQMALSGGKDKAKTLASLVDLNRRQIAFKGETHSDEAKKTCAGLTAEMLVENAMSWHLEAVGTENNKGTCGGSPTPACMPTLKAAADAYDLVIRTFSQDEFASFALSRLAPETRPSLLTVKFSAADLLYFKKDWEACGAAFDKVVEADPNGPLAPESAYAAVLCYQKYYDAKNTDTRGIRTDTHGTGNLPGESHEQSESHAAMTFEKKPMTPMQAGMSRAFHNYLCYVTPNGDDPKAKDQLVEVKYASARTYMEAHFWEEAAARFKDIALHHSTHETGMYAAQLYLEVLNILGTHSDPKRPACYDEMGEVVPKLATLYCEGTKASKYQDQCTLLTKIQCDIQRLKADSLMERGRKGGPDSLKQFESAATIYMGLWEKYGEKQVEGNKPPECNGMDEILFNAAESYQAARLVMKSIGARARMVNNKNEAIRKSDLTRRAMYKIGGNFQSIAYYENAATWFERYAREYPGSDKADTALSDAIVLRIGLGQEKEAVASADEYMRAYGASRPEETAKVAFAMGAYYVEHEDWDNARRRLQGAMGMIDKGATLDIKAQAHAMLGRVHVNLKSDSSAVSEYRKVQDLWKNPDKSADEVKRRAADDNDGLRRLAKALNAVGEAYFYFAEKEKKKVDAMLFPVYKGPSDKASVLHHINTKVVEWLTKKKPAIEAASREYEKILSLKPEPPPRWVSAAGSRVGAMWAEFVVAFRSAPIPKAWENDEQLRGAYYQALDEKSEPFKTRAKDAFEVCLKNSVKYQFFDKFSRYCEEWLATSYKDKYHQVDEFRVSATRVGSGLDDRNAPLELGGAPFHPAPPPAPEKATPRPEAPLPDTRQRGTRPRPRGR